MTAFFNALRLTLSVLLLTFDLQASACEVRVRWHDDAPYSMRAPDGALTGLNVDLAQESLARMGCRPIWVELPWARALVELEAGRLDVLPGGLRRPEREAYAHFAAQQALSRNRLFVRKADQARVGSATTLGDALWPGHRLGVQIGVVYGPEYAQLLAQPAFRSGVTQAATRRSLWQMLSMGRVDGVLASEANARWELSQLGLQQAIVATDVALPKEPAFMMISKRSRDAAWVQRFQDANDAMEADGTMARLVRKYFGD